MPAVATPDGAHLHWTEFGAGPPLVALTGQALDERLWQPLLPDLARQFRVILPQWRGIGCSSAVFPEPWTTRELAADVVRVLDGAGVDVAHVWGFSLGGRAAQWLAADHPERVAGLVLSSTTPGDRTGVPREPEITSMLLHPHRAGLADLFFTPRFLARMPEARRIAVPSVTHSPTLRAHYRASRDHDGADALPRIVAPTLVTHGSADRICAPANGRLLAHRIRGARLRLTPNGRHGAHVEFPATAAAVTRFLRDLALPAGSAG